MTLLTSLMLLTCPTPLPWMGVHGRPPHLTAKPRLAHGHAARGRRSRPQRRDSALHLAPAQHTLITLFMASFFFFCQKLFFFFLR